MALLSKEQILSSQDRAFEIIEVPEWGGQVKIASLTGSQREQYDRSMLNSDGELSPADFKTKLVALALVDENDEPMFTLDDVEQLREKSNIALERVFAAAEKLSNVTLASLEETEKN